MDTSSLSQVNIILNAIQTGGIVGILIMGIFAFVKGWIYPASTVEELRGTVKELTAALKTAGDGIDKMADAWEQRNTLERENQLQRLIQEGPKRG